MKSIKLALPGREYTLTAGVRNIFSFWHDTYSAPNNVTTGISTTTLRKHIENVFTHYEDRDTVWDSPYYWEHS